MYEKQISESQVSLCVFDEGNYQQQREDILRALSLDEKTICYVGYTKPYVALKKELASLQLKLVFVDVLTMGVQVPPIVDDCFFVQAPTSLTEVSVAISKAMDANHGPVFFDSLSSLMIYQDSHTLIKFLHGLINRIRVSQAKLVLVVLDKDAKCELVKDLSMFVDVTLR
jgi:hypothetical protein